MSHKEDILKILKSVNKKYSAIGISIVGIFGSVARGDNTEESDIDLLYQTQKGILNLYDKKTNLREELQAILNVKVDLANEKYLKPYAKNIIMKDLVYV